MSYRDTGHGKGAGSNTSTQRLAGANLRVMTATNNVPGPATTRPPRSAGPAPPQHRPNLSFQEPEEYRSTSTALVTTPPEYHRRPTYENHSQSSYPDAHLYHSPPGGDPEDGSYPTFSGADFRRKKSLVRPDRGKIEPGHPQYHYHSHVALIEEESGGRGLGVEPSRTGNVPHSGLKRGRSLLARDEDVQESGLMLFKKSANTLRRKRPSATGATPSNQAGPGADLPTSSGGIFKNIAPGPIGAWMVYCWLLTCCIPPFLLRQCGTCPLLQQT